MKKCKSCQHEVDEKLEACPECGSAEFDEIIPEASVPVTEDAENTDCGGTAPLDVETEESDEPIPFVGLIIAGIIGLIILALGLYFKLK